MKQRVQRYILMLFLMACGAAGYSVKAFAVKSEAPFIGQTGQSSRNSCLACHQQNKDDVVNLFKQSSHARRRVSCEACHGGNPTADEKASAHAGNFVARPTGKQTLERCAACHQTQLAAFQASNHIQEDGKTPRVDCVQCHGAHLIGSVTAASNFKLLCSNCHGLEYLPELPAALRNILSATDAVKNALGQLQNEGHQPSELLFNRRREMRKTVAAIVHATSISKASEQEQQILEMSRTLKEQIQSEKH